MLVLPKVGVSGDRLQVKSLRDFGLKYIFISVFIPAQIFSGKSLNA